MTNTWLLWLLRWCDDGGDDDNDGDVDLAPEHFLSPNLHN